MRAILLAALLAAAARAQINPGNQFFSGPLAPAPLTPLGQPPPDGVAQYTYGYKTEDPAEATYSEQNEQRNGNAVTGFYSTLLPDGRVQVVNYVADENGYRATVSYQTPDGIPLPSPQQAPGAPPPRAEPRQPTFLFSGPLPPLTADLGPGFGRRADSGAPLGFAGPAKREVSPGEGQGSVAVPQNGPRSAPRPDGRREGPHDGPRLEGRREGPQPLSGGRPQIRRLVNSGPGPSHQPGGQYARPNQPLAAGPGPQGRPPALQQRRLPVRPAGVRPAPWSPEANTVPTGGDRVPLAQPAGDSWRVEGGAPPPTAGAWLVADNTIRHGWGGAPPGGQPSSAASPAHPTAAPVQDHSWSHKTGSPAGPAPRSGDDEPAAPAGRVVTSSAQFSARQGRLSRRPQPRSGAVRAPRQSGAFGAGPSEPAAADPSHPRAQFIHSPLHRFSPEFGEWNPMRIRT
ncbi:Pro-resilin [Amphibalanus amphitrite]|uniref:Pro-resilin n=1 Tax=Amphibalanus amphitrite TaxID=1232801 RepID=A0A6A4X2J1_AMPAM|nr:Pro-resilin [Amphibalanus amphitrite]